MEAPGRGGGGGAGECGEAPGRGGEQVEREVEEGLGVELGQRTCASCWSGAGPCASCWSGPGRVIMLSPHMKAEGPSPGQLGPPKHHPHQHAVFTVCQAPPRLPCWQQFAPPPCWQQYAPPPCWQQYAPPPCVPLQPLLPAAWLCRCCCLPAGGFNDPDMLVVGLDGMYPYGIVQDCPEHIEGCKPGMYISRDRWGTGFGLV